MKVGLGVSEDLTVSAHGELAAEVEEAGLVSLWTNEARGRDALLVCQAWAAATSRIELGTGVIPIWTRSPAQTAMAAVTLQESSEGRLLLGLGVSHPATMGPWHGATYRRPLTAARESLVILRTLLRGEESATDGEVFSSSRFRLGLDELPPPPRLYLAAMGPKMLELAGQCADGVLLNWSTPETVSRAVGAVRASAARAETGRRPGDVEVAAYVRIAVDTDEDAARLALAREVSTYCALPAYAAHFARQGFADAVEAVKAAYRDGGGDAAARAVPESMLRLTGWFGTPDDYPASMLGPMRSAGLDHLIARVVVVGDDVGQSVRHVLDALQPPGGTPT